MRVLHSGQMDRDHDLGVAVGTNPTLQTPPLEALPPLRTTDETDAGLLTDAHTWGLRFTDAESISDVASALLDGYRGKPGQRSGAHLPVALTLSQNPGQDERNGGSNQSEDRLINA